MTSENQNEPTASPHPDWNERLYETLPREEVRELLKSMQPPEVDDVHSPDDPHPLHDAVRAAISKQLPHLPPPNPAERRYDIPPPILAIEGSSRPRHAVEPAPDDSREELRGRYYTFVDEQFAKHDSLQGIMDALQQDPILQQKERLRRDVLDYAQSKSFDDDVTRIARHRIDL